MSETSECAATDCTREPRMALKTDRTQRDVLKTTIFYDNRTAPKGATRYCKEHGKEIAVGLIEFATDGDNVIGEG